MLHCVKTEVDGVCENTNLKLIRDQKVQVQMKHF